MFGIVELEKCHFEKVDVLRLPLVNRFYSQCKYKVNCGSSDYVYVLKHEGEIIAAARLIVQSSQHVLLRNLCVSPAMRKQGVARHFMQSILRDTSIFDCYCFALLHLQNFYTSLTFVNCLPDHVPADIAELQKRYKSRQRDWVLMGSCNGHSIKN